MHNWSIMPLSTKKSPKFNLYKMAVSASDNGCLQLQLKEATL